MFLLWSNQSSRNRDNDPPREIKLQTNLEKFVLLYNHESTWFSRCMCISFYKPIYTHLYPLTLTYTPRNIVHQTSYEDTISSSFNHLKPTCGYLHSLFSLTWSLDGILSPPIQDLLESHSFMIQLSLHQHLDEIHSSPNQYDLTHSYNVSCVSKSPLLLHSRNLTPHYKKFLFVIYVWKWLLLYPILSFIRLSYDLTLISKVIYGWDYLSPHLRLMAIV